MANEKKYKKAREIVEDRINAGIIVRIEGLKDEDDFDYLGIKEYMVNNIVRELLKENDNYVKGKILSYNYIFTRYVWIKVEDKIDIVLERIYKEPVDVM